MQTSGATLLAVNRCSLVRTWTPAQGSHSAHGLLYLAAVPGGRREQERASQPVVAAISRWFGPGTGHATKDPSVELPYTYLNFPKWRYLDVPDLLG